MALIRVAIIVPCYFVFWISFGWFTMGVYTAVSDDAQALLDKNNDSAVGSGIAYEVISDVCVHHLTLLLFFLFYS